MINQPNKENSILQEELILKRIPWEILILSAGMTLFSLLIFEPLTSIFVLAGGVISALSFIWLKQSLTALLSSNKQKKILVSTLISYGLRLVLIIILFSIIIFFFSRKIWAVIAGFSTILPVMGGEAMVMLLKAKNGRTRT